MESSVLELEKHPDEIKHRVIDSEYRNMKNNIVFHKFKILLGLNGTSTQLWPFSASQVI